MKEIHEHDEFIGYWAVDSFGGFRAFVDQRKSLGKNMWEIKGRIKDRIGRADFSGVITPNDITFTKVYQPDHTDYEGPRRAILYRGERVDNQFHGANISHYQGKFWMLNEDGKAFMRGDFVMEAPNPSPTLELFMKWDANSRRHDKLVVPQTEWIGPTLPLKRL